MRVDCMLNPKYDTKELTTIWFTFLYGLLNPKYVLLDIWTTLPSKIIFTNCSSVYNCWISDKQCRPNRTPRSVAFDLGLHY